MWNDAETEVGLSAGTDKSRGSVAGPWGYTEVDSGTVSEEGSKNTYGWTWLRLSHILIWGLSYLSESSTEFGSRAEQFGVYMGTGKKKNMVGN